MFILKLLKFNVMFLRLIGMYSFDTFFTGV